MFHHVIFSLLLLTPLTLFVFFVLILTNQRRKAELNLHLSLFFRESSAVGCVPANLNL